jgi:hypothetical protein
MSRNRRLDAAETRADRAYSRRTISDAAKAMWRKPVAFLSGSREFTLLGVTVRDEEPSVQMPGDRVTVRDWYGRVVFDQLAPDWLTSLRSYAQFVCDNPRPLTARQRAKVVRRGRR